MSLAPSHGAAPRSLGPRVRSRLLPVGVALLAFTGPGGPSVAFGAAKAAGTAERTTSVTEKQVWTLLTREDGAFTGSPLIGSVRAAVKVAFFTEGGGRWFIYEGKALSITLDLLGREGKIETKGTGFSIRFTVSRPANGSFTEMGTATVTGAVVDGDIRTLRYKESFTEAAGMEFELRR